MKEHVKRAVFGVFMAGVAIPFLVFADWVISRLEGAGSEVDEEHNVK